MTNYQSNIDELFNNALCADDQLTELLNVRLKLYEQGYLPSKVAKAYSVFLMRYILHPEFDPKAGEALDNLYETLQKCGRLEELFLNPGESFTKDKQEWLKRIFSITDKNADLYEVINEYLLFTECNANEYPHTDFLQELLEIIGTDHRELLDDKIFLN